MMPTSTDFLAQKTPAELSYFVDNPSLYEPALVEDARRELQRRGLGPVRQPMAAPTYVSPVSSAPQSSNQRNLLLTLLMVAVLALGGWLWQRQQAADEQAAAIAAAKAAAAAKKGPPKLETVATTALPDFTATTAASVDQQLAQVPASELNKLAAQPKRQYRELARRFWAAETMSEYLADQARAGQSNPLLAEQALLAREAWQQWNKAAVYSYKFGPVMADHLDRMGRTASHQQHILEQMPDLVAKNEFLTTAEINKRDDEVNDLVRGLLPNSPVSGKAYRKLTLQAKM